MADDITIVAGCFEITGGQDGVVEITIKADDWCRDNALIGLAHSFASEKMEQANDHMRAANRKHESLRFLSSHLDLVMEQAELDNDQRLASYVRQYLALSKGIA